MGRVQSIKEGAKGLIAGFLDHRLFETWCWTRLYEALGGNEADLKSRWREPPSSLHVGGAELVATGYPGGRNRCSELLKGWRDGSQMPSNYAPDFLVCFAGKRPILVDAKFRIGPSVTTPCDPDGFKEVQAYLEEFSAVGALILVPAIPKSMSLGLGNAATECIEGGPASRRRRVWLPIT